jgi:hypothetical protein
MESVAEGILAREAFFWVADIRYRKIGIFAANIRPAHNVESGSLRKQ